MSENLAPRRKWWIVVGSGLLALAGALAAGFFETVGSALGAMLLPASALVPQPAPVAIDVRSSGESRGMPSSSTAEGGMKAGRSVVLDEVMLDFGGQGEGATRGEACAAALEQVTLASTRQCDSIAKSQQGSSTKLENGAVDCRSCGPTGGGWRCIAHGKPKCIVSGELDQ